MVEKSLVILVVGSILKFIVVCLAVLPSSALAGPLDRELSSESGLATEREVERLKSAAIEQFFAGDLNKAHSLFEQAEKLRRDAFGEDILGLEPTANEFTAMNTYERHPQWLMESREHLQRVRTLKGETHPDTLQSFATYAFALAAHGRVVEAEPLLREALRLHRRTLGERHPYTLGVLQNYNMSLLAMDRLKEAEVGIKEEVDLRRKALGERDVTTLGAMSNLAFTMAKLDRFSEAESLFLQVIRSQFEVLGESRPPTLTSLINYGVTLDSAGRHIDAEKILTHSMKLLQEKFGIRHENTLESLYFNVINALHLKQAERAITLSRELSSITRFRAADLSGSGFLGSQQIVRERANRTRIEQLHADVLWSNVSAASAFDEAFTALQLASGGSSNDAVVDAAAWRYAARAGLATIVRERQKLVREWPDIEAALVERQTGGADEAVTRERFHTQLGKIESRIAEIDAILAVESPQYYAVLNQQQVSREELAEILRPDEAIVMLVPTERGTHAMAVTRDDIRWNRVDIKRDEIASLVAAFREGLEIKPNSEFLPLFNLELAHKLYNELIAPVEDVLRDKARIYVVGDGALSRLPLGALVTEAFSGETFTDDPDVLRSAPWLADRYALVSLPSLQSLVYIRKFGVDVADTGDGAFAGFGAPVLEGKGRTRGARSATLEAVDAAALVAGLGDGSGAPLMNPDALRKLSRLDGSGREIEQVREALGGSASMTYLDARMTEPAIRNADLSQTRVLHLATHGLTSEESGATAEPGLVFTPPAQASAANDGYLAASEVVGLDLINADWVILSACNTAAPSGKAGETGMSGLAQAFFYAGAKSLLVSHWPVFDDIAPRLTLLTLKPEKPVAGRAEALQAAMRAVRADPALDAAHPAVWAPFALVGEGR